MAKANKFPEVMTTTAQLVNEARGRGTLSAVVTMVLLVLCFLGGVLVMHSTQQASKPTPTPAPGPSQVAPALPSSNQVVPGGPPPSGT